MSTDIDRWAADVVLSDGETVHVRAITPADAEALGTFHERQSPDSKYRRFFSAKPTLTDAELEHFTRIDMHDRVALVVERRGELIAWASYERWPGRDDAEAAFMVDDQLQGRGIATLLLEHLAAIARTNGIRRFTAEVLADNRPMLAVFARAGWPIQRHFDSGVIDVDFDLDNTHEFVETVERREQRADSRAMARLLLPRSIAVIGASDRPGSVGESLWAHLRDGFTGPLYPVNPARPTVGGVRSYASITDIADDISLAIVAVPASALSAAIDDCIAKRVRGALVITATDGTAVDPAALTQRARRNGVRLIGPASMGLASPRREHPIQAALAWVSLPEGGVAISMQSGTLGSAVLRGAAELGLGLSWFVSLGDKTDVSGNDLLQFWEDDESTRVVAMYTESFGNPRKFARIARRVGMRRPIVAVRTGAAAIGPSGSALYQHAGLIEVPTVAAMLDTARVLVGQPLPAGRHVAVVTNARSPGVLARAAIEAAGLVAVDPPLALDWRSTPDDYGRALTAALADDGVDAVLVIHAPPVVDAIAAPVDEVDGAAAGAAKPVVAVLLGRDDGPLRPGSNVPAFSFPEPAAAVLGRCWAYAHWLATEATGTIERHADVDTEAAAAIVTAALAAGRQFLDAPDCCAVLAAYGLSVTPTTVAHGADEAAERAAELGFPVAVKAAHRHVGRSARAGIALDLADVAQLREAVDVIRSTLGAEAETLLVQRMVEPGVDVRIRCTTDARLGPLVSVGLGGVQADVIGDVASRLAPLSQPAAHSLIETTRASLALHQAGLTPTDLVDAIVRIGQLLVEHPEIVELDCNPVIVSADGCWITDATISLSSERPSELALRQLG
jgi:acyl-CoA synthetase (NDP forming)/RimJ/RimL family protein N-acetyltransferase